MRVVVDPNVLISAAVATGVSAELVDRWLTERPLECVACGALVAELRNVLRREKLRRWIDPVAAERYVDLIESGDPDLTSMSVEGVDVLIPGQLLQRL